MKTFLAHGGLFVVATLFFATVIWMNLPTKQYPEKTSPAQTTLREMPPRTSHSTSLPQSEPDSSLPADHAHNLDLSEALALFETRVREESSSLDPNDLAVLTELFSNLQTWSNQ